MDLECETILLDGDMSSQSTIHGLDSVLGLTPPPEENMIDLGAGQDALEAELVHIDEQLMNIEDDLGHIDEAFIMMDQQLAESISDDVYDNDVFTNHAETAAAAAASSTEFNLDNFGVEESEELN